jgi:hypothetical protein
MVRASGTSKPITSASPMPTVTKRPTRVMGDG